MHRMSAFGPKLPFGEFVPFNLDFLKTDNPISQASFDLDATAGLEPAPPRHYYLSVTTEFARKRMLYPLSYIAINF